MNLETPFCRVCKKDYGPDNNRHFLLTCQQCNRSWHHRCHEPPISDTVIMQVWTHFLGDSKFENSDVDLYQMFEEGNHSTSPQSLRVPDPDILNLDAPGPARTSAPEIIDISESPEAPRQRRVQPSPALVVEGIIDVDAEIPPVPLAASPSDRPTRVQLSRAQAVDIIDLEPEHPHAPNPDAIEILDSPPTGAMNLPAPVTDLPLPPPAINSSVPVVELPPARVDDGGVRASSAAGSRSRSSTLEPTLSDTPTPTNYAALPVIVHPPPTEVHDGGPCIIPGHSLSMNPSLSELVLSDTPTATATRLPSMDVDTDPDVDANQDVDDEEPVWKVEEETEQKPLALLLQNLTVSDRPKGGTLWACVDALRS
ncbi:PHD-type domain-containing protein [Mycena sanguinolenta]|uniref:PHD-type domain-containing protein n=1 Tax=Mycena sanguinolenta TaxID=230812 RepID=A0A8H6YQX6_9AGAR|nr:PHD-type domain-containing protein [Mycena sanguinolenta]